MEKVLFDLKIGQKKKYIEIISIFKNKIIAGELKAGDKIPTETELMEQFGLSRTPIREAIKILEAIGIIEIKRGEGMFLRKTASMMNLNPLIMSLILQSGNIKKLIEFRQHFEQMIIELAWEHSNDQDYQKLVAQFKKQESLLDIAMDTVEWVEQDLQFHYQLLELTQNPFIIEIGKTVYALFRGKMEAIDYKVGRELGTHRLYLKVLKDKDEKDFEKLKKQIARNYSNLFSE